MRYNAVVCSAWLSSEVYHQTEHTLSNIFFLLHGSRKNMLKKLYNLIENGFYKMIQYKLEDKGTEDGRMACR